MKTSTTEQQFFFKLSQFSISKSFESNSANDFWWKKIDLWKQFLSLTPFFEAPYFLKLCPVRAVLFPDTHFFQKPKTRGNQPRSLGTPIKLHSRFYF